MKKPACFLVFVLLIFISRKIYCQSAVPHLTGKITVSVKQGTLDGEIQLSNLADTRAHKILLNKGLGVSRWSDKNGNEIKNVHTTSGTYEAHAYNLNSETNTDAITVKFNGKFPVEAEFDKLKDLGDWKGNIAFNGKTVRASEQSTWYPVLVKKIDKLEKVTYDLQIECGDCERIYLNGNPSGYGGESRFISEKPFALLLFAGEYDLKEFNGNAYLNSSLHEAQLAVFDASIKSMRNFYSARLGISYDEKITFIETTPVSKNNNWMFATFPSIVIISHKGGLEKAFNNETLKDSAYLVFIAHELGHYYFGNKMTPNSDLFWFFLEGVTSYMSLKYLQHAVGQKFYENELRKYYKRCRGLKKNFKPLNVAKDQDINTNYRYYFVPLMLTRFEQELGEEKMWQWLSFLANTTSATTDYTF